MEAHTPGPTPGTLYIIATPIGNLEDITLRALRLLGGLDALACEDTRRTRRIFERHGVSSPSQVFAYHEHNEERSAQGIVKLLGEGRSVGLCTNAGVPCISDPGYRAVAAALDAGHRVEVIPGPSAVETALVVSGLPAASYTFKGFPPKKPGPRRRFLEQERDLPHTLVIYESPFRVGKLLGAALEALGDRRAAVCIELTKMFEDVRRGFLSDLAAEFAEQQVKGEVTVVIAGNNPKFSREAPGDE